MKFKIITLVILFCLPQVSANADTAISGITPIMPTTDIYAADRPNQLSPIVKGIRELIYVPNHSSNTVSIIDPISYKILKTFKTDKGPQHIVPSWDLKTLWVNNNQGNTITPINPRTLEVGKPVKVHDPYNLYFTPDGKFAIVMQEASKKVDFRDSQNLKEVNPVSVPCAGVNHADFSADGNFFIATCEFEGALIMFDTQKQKLIAKVYLPKTYTKDPMPQDIKLSPDGKTFYIADMMSNGIWMMPAQKFGTFTFIKTGKDAHGLFITRDSKNLLITNRGEGSVSVLNFANNQIISKWIIPGGGSPDMGGISSDGTQLWVAGRYNGVVYDFDISKGILLKKIPVGREPHGLSVFPQPGKYSLGHTGIFR